MSWRVADCLEILKAEVDERWPERDTASDGAIGDERHQQDPTSDHNPFIKDSDGVGVVRARDIDSDGIDAGWLAEHVRTVGKDGDRRLAHGGYVIFNKRIASEVQDWIWREYHGEDPHTSHIHISVSRDQSGYDSEASWNVHDPFDGYTESEKRWIRDYDRLLREDSDLPRRRALRAAMTRQRKLIWRAAQPAAEGGDGKGWDHARRRDRYKSLLARTR